MPSKIQKWGNSQGLCFSKKILEQAHLSLGDEVEIVVQENALLVQKIDKTKQYSLTELLSKIPDDYESNEENWGNSHGKEEW